MLNEELMAGWEKFFLYMPTNNNITIILFDFTKFKKNNVKKFHEVD